jgi:hypothetical protein
MLESKINKICTICRAEKDVSFFNKDNQKKDGYRSSCKICCKLYYNKNREKILNQKKEYSKENYDKIEKYRKNRYEENKDILLSKQRDYHEKNKKERNRYSLRYKRNKLDTDSFFKLKETLRTLIRRSFKRGKKNFIKKISSEQILGCTINEFINHIESQLKEGMTIENHGDWHLDHIIPLATARTEEEVIKLNHYTNFQPLWAAENLSKGSKII